MSMLAEHWDLLLAMMAAGALAGLMAGLFGIGGGAIIVPVLYALLGAFGFDENVSVKTAVATSLATIILTSMRSVRAHARRGAVDMAILRAWVPWIMVGATVGAVLASHLGATALLLVFGGFLVLMAAQLAFGNPNRVLAAEMPKGAGKAVVGGGIGFLSAMMGVGGGVFGVVTMTLFGQPIHRAVGTSAGFGAAISVPAVISYMVTGLLADNDIPFSIGYVNLPGFVLISALTVSMAPLGARIAHALPAQGLRRAFAGLLLVVGTLMLRDALTA